MNMFQHWWPNLYKHPGFLKEFVTPIVKVSKGPSMQQFFTLTEYHDWRDDHNGGKGFKVKYYKGLGTSTAAEAKEYFRRIRQHEIMFKYKGDSCDEAIDMAFNKKRADDRKVWINCSKDSDFVDHSKGSLSYTAFVNMELVKFSKYDVVRSIPSVVDGFKPTQRKVLFGAFKRKLTNDLKVAQLVGYVSEQTSYHHGEASLESTIVGMAQDFVGSNNVNLLVPSGQFGTRLQGGKDHASSRYIYTRMTKAARALFPVDDDPVLEYLNDEGQSIEPRYFMPVIPMILVNGGDGIGTGWSCNVSNYNPRDIVANLQRLLKHEPMQTMHPWYAGFQGTITATPKGYDIVGKITKTGDRTLEISELPVRSWTQDYKEFLQEMIVGAQQFQPVKDKDGNMVDPSKDAVMLEDIREYHTESTVHFEVTLSLEKMQLAESIGLEKVFKMRKQTNPNSNMVLFDAKNKVKKYNDVDEIMFDFAETRLEYYHLRKTHMCEKLLRDKVTLDQKVRFVLMVISKELIISNRKKHELMQDLRKHRFPTAKQVSRLTLHEREVKFQKGDFDDEEEEAGQEKEAASGYHYLLGMPLWNLTHEKVEEMKKHALEKKNEFDELMQTSPEQLWWSDLDDVIAALDEVDAKREAALAKSKKIAQLKKEAPKGKKGKGAAEKVEVEEDFDDFDDDDDDKPSKKKLLQVKKSPPVLMPLDLGVQRVTNEAEKEARGELTRRRRK
jgi:DNA topoisomerase-2